MTILKRFLYHAAATIHKLMVLILPLIFAVAVLLSTPVHIKQALKDSHIYDNFVASVVDKSQEDAKDQNAKDILAQPEIQAGAQKAFTPALLQSSSENVIDGVFGWAQGKTTEPEFRIDLTNAKSELANSVVVYAEKRANGLPKCTLEQLRTLNQNQDIDLLEIPCLPPGIDVSAQAQSYGQQFLTESDFLKDPVITNATIAQNNDGKSISEQFSEVPKAYSTLQNTSKILLGSVLALSALLIFARKNRRAGLKHVGWTLITIGLLYGIIMISYWYMFGRIHESKAAADLTEAMWMDGAKSLVSQLNQTITWFSVSYILIGVAMLAYVRFRMTKDSTPEPSPKESETEIGKEV